MLKYNYPYFLDKELRMSAKPLSDKEKNHRDEYEGQDALSAVMDTTILDCSLNISHDHEVGENWFCPADFPDA